jgi:thiamine-phosphate pyrophosphorylase
VKRRGLYAIVDVDTLSKTGTNVVTFSERVLAAGDLFALQLRAKGLGSGAYATLAKDVAVLCKRSGVPFFVNDRLDVALVAGADGVHVGTEDLPVSSVRVAAPTLRVGTSNHSDEDVRRSLQYTPDYLAYGPVYGTQSKANASPVTGIDGLRRACEMCAAVHVTVVAIGGITLGRAPEIVASGASAGAVIAALGVDVDRATETARALHLALGGR